MRICSSWQLIVGQIGLALASCTVSHLFERRPFLFLVSKQDSNNFYVFFFNPPLEFCLLALFFFGGGEGGGGGGGK